MFGDRQLITTYPSTKGLKFIVSGDPNPPDDGLYVVVASEGGIKDWAAYLESIDSRKQGNTSDAIHDFGHKIPQEDAERLFPDWASRLAWRP